jgi:hypothetical protein
MKIIKLCIDGVNVRVRQTSDNCAVAQMDGYTGFIIHGELTLKQVVQLARMRRYSAHMCIECGNMVAVPNGYHLCADCA